MRAELENDRMYKTGYVSKEIFEKEIMVCAFFLGGVSRLKSESHVAHSSFCMQVTWAVYIKNSIIQKRVIVQRVGLLHCVCNRPGSINILV